VGVSRQRLQALVEEVAEVAKSYGLDFFETHFEIVDFETMNELAAYEGFPNRYPHWRFGMEYERLTKSYRYGLHKIYEMVINSNPAIAYLLEDNTELEHKMVIAHVFAHVDFFKNNAWFAPTNRRMLDEIANHGARIRRYVDIYGLDKVEAFLDKCLSIQNLIDFHAPYVVRRRERKEEEVGREKDDKEAFRFKTKKYLDPYVNPPHVLEEARKRAQEEAKKQKAFPPEPERDVMGFLALYAPLERWEQNVLSMVREEAYYFAPQAMTKILNEGWASFWHAKILTERLLKPSEVIDFADRHSATVAPMRFQLNPYALGLALLRDIEDRWNKGKFGKEYEECQDMQEKERWDRRLGLGLQKLFEVRRVHNDVTFIDEFLTEEFVARSKLFTYGRDQQGVWRIESRDFHKIKERLLSGLVNLGEPFISVVDGNYGNRGELLLEHRFEGVELRRDWARQTLQNIASIWKRPVLLSTVFDNEFVLLRHDGKEYQIMKGKP
jgi:stage V sporulation protein R